MINNYIIRIKKLKLIIKLNIIYYYLINKNQICNHLIIHYYQFFNFIYLQTKQNHCNL